jgi:hypothetical protein
MEGHLVVWKTIDPAELVRTRLIYDSPICVVNQGVYRVCRGREEGEGSNEEEGGGRREEGGGRREEGGGRREEGGGRREEGEGRISRVGVDTVNLQ